MPEKEVAFRLKGERENGFKKLMEKFKKNGWIRESNSAWGGTCICRSETRLSS